MSHGPQETPDAGTSATAPASATDPVAYRVCIFCRRTGAEVKLSREHTFSNWINTVLTSAEVGTEITCIRTTRSDDGQPVVDSWPAAKIASHRVRAVCKPCNEGWMNDLEIQVRPLIEPAILGRNISLTPDQQITVATWVAMKAAVFEYVWAQDPILTDADRQVIMSQTRPPASAQVRLAAIESNGYPLRAAATGYVSSGTGNTAFCLTLSIGCIVFQFFGGPGAGNHDFRTPGAVGPNFIGIYPPRMQGINWPPSVALDDESIKEFSDPLRGLHL